jgi:thioredoxin reductase (NADPH)
MSNRTKLLIIGSGPAGYSAAIYAARANLKPTIVKGIQPGGQLTITTDVENYPGFADTIQGPWLMEQMEKQTENVGADIIADHIKEVDFSTRPFKCIGESGTEYIADSIIISTGAQAKWLGLESETKFQGFGVSGCATCDGFFYKNKEVVVIGGGNTAVEEALYLTNHASKVTLIHRRDTLRAEQIIQGRLFKHPKIEVIWDTELKEVLGSENPLSVTGIKVRNSKTGDTNKIAIDGVFIAIGHKPNTDIFRDKLALDNDGYIITEPGSTKTNIEGIFAAGDVQDKVYRQAITAAGTGCMAALDAEKLLADV